VKGEKELCLICGGEMTHRHPSAKVCSLSCALERDESYYRLNRAVILAKQRLYNRRQAALLAEDRKRRFGGNDGSPSE